MQEAQFQRDCTMTFRGDYLCIVFFRDKKTILLSWMSVRGMNLLALDEFFKGDTCVDNGTRLKFIRN